MLASPATTRSGAPTPTTTAVLVLAVLLPRLTSPCAPIVAAG
jgi:hypothetical protein